MKKRRLYANIVWTSEQKQAFRAFWKENYGKTISPRWHKLYQSFNGVFCVEYFPEILYTTRLEKILNSENYRKIYSDKILTGLLYADESLGVRTPRTFLCKDVENFYGANHEYLSEEQAVALFSDLGDAVIKPTVDSGSGHNVRMLSMHGGKDSKTGQTALAILKQYRKNFIVQERLRAHPSFAALYPAAINTIRVITYRSADGINLAPMTLRIGSSGGEVDNIHAAVWL